MRKTLIATLFAMGVSAVPVAAQQLNVYDANGKLVGPLVGEDTAVVTLGGFQQYLTIGKYGLATNAQLYFGGPNCVTEPLVAYDEYSELFPHAVYDGTTLYYLDPRQDAGLAVQSQLVNGKCVNLPDNQSLNATSAHAISSPWAPPFSVR